MSVEYFMDKVHIQEFRKLINRSHSSLFYGISAFIIINMILPIFIFTTKHIAFIYIHLSLIPFFILIVIVGVFYRNKLSKIEKKYWYPEKLFSSLYKKIRFVLYSFDVGFVLIFTFYLLRNKPDLEFYMFNLVLVGGLNVGMWLFTSFIRENAKKRKQTVSKRFSSECDLENMIDELLNRYNIDHRKHEVERKIEWPDMDKIIYELTEYSLNIGVATSKVSFDPVNKNNLKTVIELQQNIDRMTEVE